jgi:hypothetical protein
VQRRFRPRRSPRAIVVSFDNLGEASELKRGSWAAKAELGRDPSVTVALPSLLDELDALGLAGGRAASASADRRAGQAGEAWTVSGGEFAAGLASGER